MLVNGLTNGRNTFYNMVHPTHDGEHEVDAVPAVLPLPPAAEAAPQAAPSAAAAVLKREPTLPMAINKVGA